MLFSEARVVTSSASRYLVQLCKHWSHKFAVDYTPVRGRVPFGPDRACTFQAEPEFLAIRLEAADEATLTRLEGIVVEHLKRFAFREDLGRIE